MGQQAGKLEAGHDTTAALYPDGSPALSRSVLEQHCRQLTVAVRQRCEAVALEALRGCPPAPGLRLTVSELGVRAELTNDVLDQRQRFDVWQYIHRASDRLGSLPAPSLAERVSLIVTRVSQYCIKSDWPFMWRRCVLRWLASLNSRLGERIPEHNERHMALTQALGTALNEPAATLRQWLIRHRFWLDYQYARRLAHLDSDSDGGRLLADFIWPDRDAYLACLQADSASRVLVTIHMGDFFGAFRVIASEADPGRQVTSLRREEDDGRVQRMLVNNPGAHHIARHGIDQPTDIIAALRKGNHTLTALFDLSTHFGETVEVLFFGQPARFVRGPAQMAIMGRARIIPFVTYESGGRQIVEMASAIDVGLRSGESLQDAAARITQQLATLAERWIRQHPEQWKYLDRLLGYFSWAQQPAAGGRHA